MTLYAPDLRRALKIVIAHASHDDTRPHIFAIQLKGGVLTGTDGRRLAQVRIAEDSPELIVSIPEAKRWLKALSKCLGRCDILGANRKGPTYRPSLDLGAGWASFVGPLELLQETFPPVHKVIPPKRDGLRFEDPYALGMALKHQAQDTNKYFALARVNLSPEGAVTFTAQSHEGLTHTLSMQTFERPETAPDFAISPGLLGQALVSMGRGSGAHMAWPKHPLDPVRIDDDNNGVVIVISPMRK